MSMYIVRLAETLEFVGIFAAGNESELAGFVDEIVAPCDCEFAHCPNGGLISAASGAAMVPMPALDPLDVELGIAGPVDFADAMRGLRPTAAVEVALQSSRLQWRPLDPMIEHPGSQLDALLSTAEGRAYAARMFREAHQVSLSGGALPH